MGCRNWRQNIFFIGPDKTLVSHIDCIYGKNAAKDVYAFMLDHLEGAGK